jgi:inner membrane protein
MLIAHAPAGYLLTLGVQKIAGVRSRAIMAAGLTASVLPDLDLAWFYLVDDRRIAHHGYVTHTPVFWCVMVASFCVLTRMLRIPQAGLISLVLLGNLLLHLVLDSVAAEVRWLWPLSASEINLFHVAPRYDWWVWSFVLHWTFLVEIAITIAAIVVLGRRHRQARAAHAPR